MRHRVRPSRLGNAVLRKRQIIRQQAKQIIRYGAITTTLSRAKTLRPYIERLVTVSRMSTVAARRTLFRHLQDDTSVKKLVETIGPRYAKRPGGYTSIVRVGRRLGDNAIRAKISFVAEEKKSDEKSDAKKA